MGSTLFLSIVLLLSGDIADGPAVEVVPALFLDGSGEAKVLNLMLSTLIGDGAT